MRLLLIVLLFATFGCQEKKAQRDEIVTVKEEEYLSPKDLNIQKHRFTASPSAREVAILRTSLSDRLKPGRNMVFDQILWSAQKDVQKDVVIASRSFYLDRIEPEVYSPETAFRDRWRIQAGGFLHDVDDYSFVIPMLETERRTV